MIINLWLCWSVSLLKFIQTLDHDWQLALEMRTGWPVAKSPRLIVLNIDWVQFVLKNCEIPFILSEVCMINRYCFASDVMYNKYKRLVYTPSDLLARISKVNLSNAKKFGLICFPRICFRGPIYCDQEPLWFLNETSLKFRFKGTFVAHLRWSTYDSSCTSYVPMLERKKNYVASSLRITVIAIFVLSRALEQTKIWWWLC